MKISTVRGGGIRSNISKYGITLALATVIGGIAMCPVYADNDDHGHRDRGNRGHDREQWRRGYDHHDWRGQPVYEPYPVYAPPPVYYPPEPASGISLFFPIVIR